MMLDAGQRIGPYEVLEQIGAGGMGEVYRARDTRLNRIVAIKVIGGRDTSQPDYRVRFEREAKAISSFNNPHICTVFDFGIEENRQFLVMEYLEGETLADRLKRGPMRLQELLRCATEVADALSHAHRRGLVHRDLKPANVMLTKAGTKVLDFGLARPMTLPVDQLKDTVTKALTAEGTVVGTCPYMSPEQLHGREVDARSDIFSLGAVLHEMATAQRAFKGDTAASTIAAVLEHDPPTVSQLRPGLPPSLDWIVKTCLEKEPEDRWQTAHDLALQLGRLREVQSDTVQAAHPPKRTRDWLRTAAAAFAGLVIGAGLITAWSRWSVPSRREGVLRFEIGPPRGTSFAVSPNASVPVIGLAVSPDGSKIAFVVDQNGVPMIWVRPMSEPIAQPLAGTEGGQQPFWSPDSQSLGFFAQNSLKRIDAGGRGPVMTLAEVSVDPRGGAWLGSGMIIYAPSNRGCLLRIPAAGGQPVDVFVGKGSRQRWWPSPLPDGQRFIYYDRAGGGLFVGSLDGAASERVISTNWAGMYVDPGHVMYLRDGKLMTQEFDTGSAAVRGEATLLADSVGGGTTGTPGFSASRSGVVAHSDILVASTRIGWYDRRGTVTAFLTELGQYMDPRVSPEGERVVWSRVDPARLAQDIWMFDLKRGTTRVTSDPLIEASPVWSRDGARMLYRSNRTGLVNLYLRDLSTGSEHLIFKHEGQWQAHGGTQNAASNDLSPDGRYALYTVPGRTGFDLFRLALDEPDAIPQPLAKSAFNEIHAALSPDGRRLAFTSDDSGRFEVYVQSFPEGKGRQLISIKGGTEPQWGPNGRELYFLDPAGKLMAASFNASGESATPQELFAVRTPSPTPYRQNYHPTSDGQKFAINAIVDGERPATITVIVNWTALLK